MSLLLKVRWPPALGKEEGPNVSSSSNRRGLQRERRREPGGRTSTSDATALPSVLPGVKKKIKNTKPKPLLSFVTSATHCSQPSGCPPTATRWSTPSTRTATATSWPSRILTPRTRRSWSWTAGRANPSLVTCTGPACMRGCCWPCTTEVRRRPRTFSAAACAAGMRCVFTRRCSASAEDLR